MEMNSEFLQDKEIIVASNRGPVVFKRDDKGKIQLIRGAGGIVGSMMPFLQKTRGKWVSSAIGEFDHHINKKYCSNYDIECIKGYGEGLSQIFPQNFFHLIYSVNAIDHSQNPQKFINNIHHVLKPGGYLVLQGFIKEGSAAHWFGLHQWDIDIENNDLLLTNKKRTIYRENLTKEIFNLIWKNVDGCEIGNKYTMVYKKKYCNF